MAEEQSTPARDRLNQLFSGCPRPAPPDPGKPHFSEVELDEKAAQDQEPWTIPSTAQYPRQIVRPPQPERNVDCLTSSDDEDDYVAAFKPKVQVSMKPASDYPGSSRWSAVLHHNPHNTPAVSYDGVDESITFVPEGKRSSKGKSKDTDLEERVSANPDYAWPTSPYPVKGVFCQFSLAAAFPYKYMNDKNDRVSRHFFAQNKFYQNTWDLFYLYPPYTLSSKPILLVPYAQFAALAIRISEAFNVPVSVPPFPFTLTFYDDGTPRPRFIGISRSRDKARELHDRIPPPSVGHGECPDDASPEVRQNFEAFRAKCQDALAASKRKGPLFKQKKKEEDRLLTYRDWYSQLRRAQRYLGLRRRQAKPQPPPANLPWTEEQQYHLQQIRKAHNTLDPLDVNLLAPFPFEKQPVIIAVDIESYERDHKLITEIGVSTLDTLDLVDLPPGEGGKNWTSQIRSRHFRIQERAHMVNKDFCTGNPDAFHFGKSEFVALSEAAAKVDSCFEWPFSVQFKHPGLSGWWDITRTSSESEQVDSNEPPAMSAGVSIGPSNSEQAQASRAAGASVLQSLEDPDTVKDALGQADNIRTAPDMLQRGSKERNIILLGHDIESDLAYLRVLGSKIFSPSRATYPVAAMNADEGAFRILASIVEALDTAKLYRILKQEKQNRKLGSILHDLDIPYYFLHNAGNDARYTMEALVAMAIKDRLEEDNPDNERRVSTTENQASDMADPAPYGEWKLIDTKANSSDVIVAASAASMMPANDEHEPDAYEAAILAPSDSGSPPKELDPEIVAVMERLKMDTTCDYEEPKRGFWSLGCY
ncbi:hypothetical protein ABEF95_012143 [Exophiala dermatitidis]